MASSLVTWKKPLVYGAILFGVVTTIFIAYAADRITDGQLALALLPMLGTFVGATYAFQLNEARAERELHKDRREALNRALFVLVRQANAIHQLHLRLQQYPGPLALAFVCPASSPPPYTELAQDFGELAFLFESDPQLLMHISIEQERFFQALSSLKIRNEFYIEKVQPAMSQASLFGRPTKAEELRSALGEVVYTGAMKGAQVARDHIAFLHDNLPKVHKQLHSAAKRLYPKHKFIGFDRSNELTSPSEESQNSPAGSASLSQL